MHLGCVVAGSKKANRSFGFARFVFCDELFDGIEHLRELLVVAGFHGLDAQSKVAVRVHQAAQLHKRAHDGDVDLNRTLGAQYAGKHGDTLLGEGVRNGATATVCA